jgi:hypothetical protein
MPLPLVHSTVQSSTSQSYSATLNRPSPMGKSTHRHLLTAGAGSWYNENLGPPICKG